MEVEVEMRWTCIHKVGTEIYSLLVSTLCRRLRGIKIHLVRFYIVNTVHCDSWMVKHPQEGTFLVFSMRLC